MKKMLPFLLVFDRQTRRTLRALHARNLKPRRSVWGFDFAGPAGLSDGSFERQETALFRRLMADADLLVNVGAHVGYYCCHALSMGKRALAIEPNPDNLHDLVRNISMNGWSRRAEIFPVAVGEHSDVLNMWGSGTAASVLPGWAGNKRDNPTRVPVLPLDRIVMDAIGGQKTLFVVDVEGAEHLVLRGAERCLGASPRPTWMVEIMDTIHRPEDEPRNPNLVEVFRAFFDRGYQCTTADERAEVIDLDRIHRAASGQPLPHHNFLFR